MNERRSHHLSEEQLARYQDGGLPPREASHLEVCTECSRLLRDLHAATAAYRRYLDSIRAPALPPPPQPWRTLDNLIAQHEAPVPRRALRWWLLPALGTVICLSVVIGFVLRRTALQSPASELLARSATMELPANRMVSLRLHGRSLARPAVLLAGSADRDPDLAHLARLFTRARYSWQEPLSARSFQSWRTGLREKRDSVTVIHGGPETAYRVRTDTPGGILRSAALTLRAKDLHPTQGAFQFEGEEPLLMEESTSALPPPVSRQAPDVPKMERQPVQVETPASPADTLHVLAALNTIGADVGEPIEVSVDSGRQVLVRAAGLSPDRLRQIAAVLQPLAHVKFEAAHATPDARPPAPQTAAPERSSAGMPGALRQQFEDRLGGAVTLQEMTDRVLEACGLAVARAHAIEVLATNFPPQKESALSDHDRELLSYLHHLHWAALRDLAASVESDLEPLLSRAAAVSEPPPHVPWQTQSPELVAAAQQVDNSLNRLLAGSYSQPVGEDLLNSLSRQLAHLREVIEFQNERGR